MRAPKTSSYDISTSVTRKKEDGLYCLHSQKLATLVQAPRDRNAPKLFPTEPARTGYVAFIALTSVAALGRLFRAVPAYTVNVLVSDYVLAGSWTRTSAEVEAAVFRAGGYFGRFQVAVGRTGAVLDGDAGPGRVADGPLPADAFSQFVARVAGHAGLFADRFIFSQDVGFLPQGSRCWRR